MIRTPKDYASINGMTSHFISTFQSLNVYFRYFITISFDKNQLHDQLNQIDRRKIRTFHNRVYKDAAKYTNKEWLISVSGRPNLFSTIERKDAHGNPVFPHIHSMLGVNDNYEDEYFSKLNFYSEKYGRRLIGVKPDVLIKPIDNHSKLVGYICKNMDLNYEINDDFIIEGEVRSRLS